MDERRPTRRPPLSAGLHLFALWSFAATAPLLDLLGGNPDFLAFRRMDGLEVVLFALALAFGPPLLLFAIELAVSLVSWPASRKLHIACIALLSALIAIRGLKKLGLEHTTLMLILAAAGGIAAAALYLRAPPVRLFLTALSPVSVVFPAVFLFASQASGLVFPNDVEVSSTRIGGDTPVVMVVFDEVSTVALLDRQRRIDPVLFPNLASLARDATWFPYATASTDATSTAIPTLLTGTFPDLDAPPILSKYPNNLFTFLGRSYRMEVSQEVGDLCPRTSCNDLTRGGFASRLQSLASDTGLVYLHVLAPPDAARDLPSVSETIGDFGADTEATQLPPSQIPRALEELTGHRAQRFLRLVDAIRPGRGPTLYYKHSLLPHVPHQYLPSGRSYSRGTEPIPGLEGEPSWRIAYLRRQAYQRHLLQTQFADFLLGTLLRRLRSADFYDRALIVVTADGGESYLHAADRNAAMPGNVADIAATPLVIKAPRQHRGRIVEQQVRMLDVLPTIADLLDAHLPWKVDGRSVWSSRAGIPREVRMLRRGDKPLVLEFGDFKRRIRASVERKLRVFASTDSRLDLFHFGPHAELIGRRLSELQLIPHSSISAALTDSSAYDRVDLESGVVPAHITGEIEEPRPGGRNLAFALNGRIVGVAPSFKLAGADSEQFSIVVSDQAFHDGRNSLAILWVKGRDRSATLERIGGTG